MMAVRELATRMKRLSSGAMANPNARQSQAENECGCTCLQGDVRLRQSAVVMHDCYVTHESR
jgi:hypothetical protein